MTDTSLTHTPLAYMIKKISYRMQKMTRTVVETPEYQKQVAGILNDTQRKSIQTLLSHDPFMGDEIQVGNFYLLELSWSDNIKISYLAPTNNSEEVFLLSITRGKVEFVENNKQATKSFLQQFSIGVSSRVVANALIEILKDSGLWFD
jgi:hypothetical protein